MPITTRAAESVVARNVEIKARCADLAALTARVEAIAGPPAAGLYQDDIFFDCAAGRLKLRDFGNGQAELIAYERPDAAGPGLSSYTRTTTDDPDGLRTTLSRALHCWARVIKTRRLYRIGRTRIHLDRVETLGDFVELEVVLAGHESAADGEKEANRLMTQLGIAPADLCATAYADMLAAQTGI